MLKEEQEDTELPMSKKMATGVLQQKLLNISETVPIVFTLFSDGGIGYHNGR